MVRLRNILLAESRVAASFSITKWCQILISGTFWKNLFSGAIFEQIFQPKGEVWDLVEACFPNTFSPSFLPPIHFWRRIKKKLNFF